MIKLHALILKLDPINIVDIFFKSRAWESTTCVSDKSYFSSEDSAPGLGC